MPSPAPDPLYMVIYLLPNWAPTSNQKLSTKENNSMKVQLLMTQDCCNRRKLNVKN